MIPARSALAQPVSQRPARRSAIGLCPRRRDDRRVGLDVRPRRRRRSFDTEAAAIEVPEGDAVGLQAQVRAISEARRRQRARGGRSASRRGTGRRPPKEVSAAAPSRREAPGRDRARRTRWCGASRRCGWLLASRGVHPQRHAVRGPGGSIRLDALQLAARSGGVEALRPSATASGDLAGPLADAGEDDLVRGGRP
jgi:hypothetical protein